MHICNCEHPVTIRTSSGLHLVGCGKCNTCQNQHRFTWQKRLEAESKCHKYTYFFTATYSDEFCPKYFKFDDLLYNEFGDSINFKPWFYEQLDKIYTSKFQSEERRKAREKEERYFDRYESFCYPRFSDLQRMFKSARTFIRRKYGINDAFRYFVCSEIGPNTHRIHYHGVIWFDDDRLAKSTGSNVSNFKGQTHAECELERIFYKYYSVPFSNTSGTRFFNLCSRQGFELSPDLGHAGTYSSKYVTCNTSLPLVYRHPNLRTRFICSRKPIIGFNQFSSLKVEQIFEQTINKISIKPAVDSSPVDVPLLRGLENNIFRKCVGFSEISHYDRIKLYEFSEQTINGTQYETLIDLWNYYCNYYSWLRGCYVNLVDNYISLSPFEYHNNFYWNKLNLKFVNGGYVLRYDNVKRLFYDSHHVLTKCQEFGVSLDYYLRKVELYYEKKEYEKLKKQLSFEEQYALNNSVKELIHIFPSFLDKLLSSSHCENYMLCRDVTLSTFGIDYETLWKPFLLPSRLDPVSGRIYYKYNKKYHAKTGRYGYYDSAIIGSAFNTSDYRQMVIDNKAMHTDKSNGSHRSEYLENKNINHVNYREYG